MQSVMQIIEEIKEDICSNYCKMPEQFTPEEWEEKFMEVCSNCPLDRL